MRSDTTVDGRRVSGEPVVSVTGVSKAIDGVDVLRDVSLTLREGDVYGLLGPNGAGKTTTIETILGLRQPDEGRVRLLGEPPGDDALREVGVVFESETLKPSWTVRDNLLVTCHVHELPPARIESCLDRVRLDPSVASEPFDTLSKGMKRKVSIADALLSDPDVLVLDEPVSGLDPESRETVLQLVESSDRSILFSSHALSDVQRVCDRVGIVRDGRTVLETRLDDSLQVVRDRQSELAGERVAPGVELYWPDGAAAGSGDTEPAGSGDLVDSQDVEQIDLEALYFALTPEDQS
ncbi:ABC transporter ATP-binding protein [Halobaculum sp. MBLA0147]|uniref:ABC transporter ATP-binding protein n=1 Tax=Halobaculum sp. MBLA0147 TaxID=3079934 RepID=UPI00352502C8